MLSILIPTFNYDVRPLVLELLKQLGNENIDFEIIVGDDQSTNKDIVINNGFVNSFKSCSYIINQVNKGRAENRNSLVRKSQFDWILFLDSDIFPKSNNFIKNYHDCMRSNSDEVFFGGLIYDSKKPKKTEMLRWIYGKKREAIELKNRKLNPYETTLTSNLLIKKKILENHPFHADIKNYGYEDLVFINELKKNKIQIKHTENPTYHLNLEESSIFLDKIQTSLNNLKLLIDKKIIQSHETKFSSMYSKLSRYKLTLLVELQFNILKSVYTKNLMSKKPSLLVYDLYRIGYYCMINSKK